MSVLTQELLFQIQAYKLPQPTLEHRFHAERRWRFDMAYLDKMIAIEVEGGTWINGAHSRGKHFQSDCEKYNEATLLGWRLLRFTSNQIKYGYAVQVIEKALLF